VFNVVLSQLEKERRLKAQLQQAQTELQPLEEQVTQISKRAKLNNNGFVWLGLGGSIVTYDPTLTCIYLPAQLCVCSLVCCHD